MAIDKATASRVLQTLGLKGEWTVTKDDAGVTLKGDLGADCSCVSPDKMTSDGLDIKYYTGKQWCKYLPVVRISYNPSAGITPPTVEQASQALALLGFDIGTKVLSL